MSSPCFPDTTVFCNFAAIDRLDLLREFLAGRGRVVEAVRFELERSARVVPHLPSVDFDDLLGEPIRLESESDVRAVEITRRATFGGRQDEPLKHLGESQTLHVIATRTEFANAMWITDDRDAYWLGRRRGLVAKHTVDVLHVLVANGELSPNQALEYANAMTSRGRSLVVRPLAPSFFAS